MRGEPISASSASPFLPFVYSLGRRRATGLLRVPAICDVLHLRDGAVLAPERDALSRQTAATLARVASLSRPEWTFEAGPVPAGGHALSLLRWLRRHVEAELDLDLAERITAGLAGARVGLRPGREPDLAALDATDRALMTALARPRSLAELGETARAPRFHLLAFLHFLGSVGALVVLRSEAAARLPPPFAPS